MGLDARGPYPRAVVGAVLIALAAARLASQAPAPPRAADDVLMAQVVGRIAALDPSSISLDVSTLDPALQEDLLAGFAARGVRVVPPTEGVPALRVSCATNLRERACAVDMSGPTRAAFFLTQSRTSGGVDLPVLQLRPLLSERTRILDVAVVGSRTLVLTPGSVIVYDQRGGGRASMTARPLSSSRTWPRDVRGRLRVVSGTWEAYLPGIHCSGDVEVLSSTCAEREDGWPVEVDNVTLDRDRNFFRWRGAGGGAGGGEWAFYAIAPLAPDAGARWIAASLDGRLTLVSEGGQRVPTAVEADDVVSVESGCGGRLLVAAGQVDRDTDQVTAFHVVARRVTPAGPSLRLPGRLTALWPAGADAATVVTYDPAAARYDAHHLTVSCLR